MSNEADVVKFAETVSELSGGHVDVLVNNAATFVFESAEDVTEAGESSILGPQSRQPRAFGSVHAT